MCAHSEPGMLDALGDVECTEDDASARVLECVSAAAKPLVADADMVEDRERKRKGTRGIERGSERETERERAEDRERRERDHRGDIDGREAGRDQAGREAGRGRWREVSGVAGAVEEGRGDSGGQEGTGRRLLSHPSAFFFAVHMPPSICAPLDAFYF